MVTPNQGRNRRGDKIIIAIDDMIGEVMIAERGDDRRPPIPPLFMLQAFNHSAAKSPPSTTTLSA